LTLMKEARLGKKNDLVNSVAKEEHIDSNKLLKLLATGNVVILKNTVRDNCHPIGIGEGLRTKVNANIGTSSYLCNINNELKKSKIAVKYGADTVMDLSTGGNIDRIRQEILKKFKVPLGTVPIYQAAIEAIHKHNALVEMTEDEIFNTIEKHARDGVDFMTVHAGITKSIVERLGNFQRNTGVVSRGGVFLASWILHHKKENPLYSNFDYLLEIARKYDFCISLGDALRPGCIADSSDWFQLQELMLIGDLVERCRKADVQVIVEGPGHMPLNQIEANVVLEKSICNSAPFYVLGPLVTDIGAGYDHIVGAIGGAIAAMSGADFLCYVTPSEHLGLPTIDDVKNGVIASKLAAHSADLVKLGHEPASQDLKIAEARRKLNWSKMYKFSVDPERARQVHMRGKSGAKTCSMCGEYCVFKILPGKQKKLV
jgi:phosphomethylpyrimidine synthase